MNRWRRCLLFGIVLGLVILLNAKEIFSQESRSIQPFRPNHKIQQNDKSELIKQWAEHYKKSYGIKELYVYKAAVLNSSAVCDAAGNSDVCREKMAELLVVDSLAIGRCKDLSSFDKSVCMGLKAGDCSGLGRLEMLACQSLLNLDPEILKGSSDIRGDRYDKKDVSRAMAYYTALRNDNVMSCIQIIGDDAYSYKLGCRILVSPEPQKIIDSLALDFAYYHYSDIKNAKSACSDINDEYVKGYCEKGTDLSQFIEQYLLGD